MRQISGRVSARLRGGTLYLALLGIGAALLYAAALWRFPLLPIYAHPIQNLEKLTLASGATGLALAGAVLLLFAGYSVGALLLARSADAESAGGTRSLGLAVIGFPLLFLVLLLLVYPVTSVDIYDYLFRGRMQVRYGANTFIQIPHEFKSDPLFWFVAWRRAVTAYGPLWEGMSWLTARLAGEQPGVPGTVAGRDAELLHLLLAYKGLAALGFLLCGAAIWGALGHAGTARRRLGLYLWLWNPLALWETIGAGHNDAWMALLIVLAVWSFQKLRVKNEELRVKNEELKVDQATTLNSQLLTLNSIGAFLALTAGGLVKFLALFLGPVFLAAALRRMPGTRARLRLVLLGGGACVALVVLAYAPFWMGWETLRNFGDRGTLFNASWLTVLQALLTLGVSEGLAEWIAVSAGLVLLAFGMAWAARRAWRAPERIHAHALWLLLWFLFFCNPWFQPWYVLWVMALVALQPWSPRIAWGASLFCCTAMLSYGAEVFLLPLLGWDTEQAVWMALWNALLCLLIYAPPLLALTRGRRLRPRAVWERVGRRSRALLAGRKRRATAQ